jgi:arginyl-tRNA synthetase
MRNLMPSPLPANPFAAACARAVARATGIAAEELSVSAPPRPELGDFAVACFPAARALKQAPPAVAAKVAASFEPDAWIASAIATGPFVNFRVKRAAMYQYLFAATLGVDIDVDGAQVEDAPDADAAPSLLPRHGAGKTICIDYSSPNISKHLAYHHIRSTVIGHALVNLYRACGYRVIGINHLGDWGTTHGMLLAACARWGEPSPLDITGLNDLYVRFREAMKTDPSLEEEARQWFKRLEDGEPDARALWQRFRDVSWAEYETVYQALGIVFDEVRGESDYLADMPAVLDLLAEKGLSRISQGALVVPFENAEGVEEMPPLLLKKGDGATLYATRDLAAAMYRWNSYGFERSLYVVGRGQDLHFKQLFRTLAMAGFPWAERCMHVPFGLVRVGGKMAATRLGNVVLLREVFAEATERSAKTIKEKNPTLDDATIAATAPIVGIGAVVFANLFAQRERDSDFEWEQVLSTQGDSGVYVQYAHARCASILRKAAAEAAAAAPGAGVAPVSAEADATLLAHDAEWAVAKRLAEVGDIVARAADGNDPHILTHYLLDLCGDFSRWYTLGNGDPALRVLCADPATRGARLALVAVVKGVLKTGLGLLGLGAPEAM